MNDGKEIQIEKLFIFDPVYGRTINDIVITQSHARDREFQKLIVLIELPKMKLDQRATLDTIVQHAVKAFDSSRHFTPEQVLESILESLNLLLPELAPKRSTDWLASLNILVAISERGQVHFSQLGDMQALLAQDNAMTPVTEPTAPLNPLKLFSHITSGLLDPGNTLVLSTSRLLEYVSEEKVKRIVTQYPPIVAIGELEKLLAEVPSYIGFAAVVIKFTTDRDDLTSRPITVASVPATSRSAHDDDIQPQPALAHQPERARRKRQYGQRRSFSAIGILRIVLHQLRILGELFFSGVRMTVKMIVRVVRAIFSATVRQDEERTVVDSTMRTFKTFNERFRTLPRISRGTLIILVGIIFIMLHVLIFKNQDQQTKRADDVFNETLRAVATFRKSVDNAVIYNDERSADRILMQIQQLLQSAAPLNKEQEDQLAQYLDETERDLNKVRHINSIAEPFVYADLTTLNAPLNTIAFAGNALVVGSNHGIYRVENGQPSLLANIDVTIVSLLVSDGTTYALTAAGELYRLSGSSAVTFGFTRHTDNAAITDAVIYGRNLYVLDSTRGALFKYNGSNQSMGAGSVWLDDPEVLKNATRLAVDGNVYITTNEGSIHKFFRGSRDPFDYHEFNPPLGARTRMYTSQKSNLIYLLDPDNRRVALLDKQGLIKDQFTSPKFDDLISLAANESEHTIAVLNGHTIYVLAINQ
ncbi:MAG: hypothetical protein AAB490_00815 [Patescibacteria group bacterium]